MGSNAAEHHPISFKWVLRAKDNGAMIIHVDPKFSRTSARSDLHVPLRSGTDIAFLGGMVRYILEKELYQKDYVTEYTNATFILGKDYGFKDGLFSGYDEATRKYDRKKWDFARDDKGVSLRDKTLKDPRCVLQVMKKHYDRYTVDMVSKVTGVSKQNLLKVYEVYSATGKPDKAGTMMYALGWTQHTVGVQNIRLAAMIQLLLGNIGVAGGGVNALRGEPNVQGSTDHAVLWDILPGYLPAPLATQPTLAQYNAAITPKTNDPMSINWKSNQPKYAVSLFKGWFGEAATKDNDYGYAWTPKVEPGEEYASMFMFDRIYKNEIKGGFIIGHNPAQSMPNTHKIRKSLQNLDWLVMGEVHLTETTDFWRGPGVDPKKVKTEMFLLPCCHRGEKGGTATNSGRWQMWHHKGYEPLGVSKSMGTMEVEIFQAVRDLYAKEGGVFPEPVLKLDLDRVYDAEKTAMKVNGWFTRDCEVNGKKFKKGDQVPSFAFLTDDGATTSLCWLYSGSYPEVGKNLTKRRDHTQTPMQAKIGLFPNFSWAWPVNRRIIYNRAGVDVNGKPFNPELPVVTWDGSNWVGDVVDGGGPPMAQKGGKYPFIMHTEGLAQLFGPGRVDGPLPEHYEPAETPLVKNPFSKQMNNPVIRWIASDMDKFAKHGDPRFPIVLTTYSLTEHWLSGSDSRNIKVLLEAEPQLYVEMSHELAKEKGIKNGDVVEVESIRGKVQAVAMVTIRVVPFKVMGKTVHLIGMPFAFGWTTPGVGDSTNRLTPTVGDPNTYIPEFKASLVTIRKAPKVTELER
jgi:formate dehydrogenase major subunit